MKIRYNAPTVLTFTLICALVMLFTGRMIQNLQESVEAGQYFFVVHGRNNFNPADFFHWIGIFTHAIGHASWAHLAGNLTIILLIGPMLEENHGSLRLLVMMVITAFVTGVLNILFFSTALLGASGIVFMMILLSSFTNFSKGEVPLTFILVLILYMGSQVIEFFKSDNNISQFAHIIGGLCGSFFGFINPAASAEIKKTSGTARRKI